MGPKKLQLHNWYVTSEDFTQWIDYFEELDSIFTLDVTWELDSLHNGYVIRNRISEEKNTRKMTLVTQENYSYCSRQWTLDVSRIGFYNQSSGTNFYFHGVN